MHLQRRIQKTQIVLAGGALLLALCYAFLYRPLLKTSQSLNAPLIRTWQSLVTTNENDLTVEGLALQDVQEVLHKAQMHRARFEAVREALMNRLALEPFITTKLNAPFQLIDFLNERQRRLNDLETLAATHSVKLQENLFDGFPNYPVAQGSPAALWAHMALAENILAAAIRSDVETIASITLRAPKPTVGPTPDQPGMDEVPIEIALTGPMPAVWRFLAEGEAQALGLPAAAPSRTALFIGGLIIKRLASNKSDRVSLNLTAVGFVPSVRPLPGRPIPLLDAN
jgi:hypothetical protein